MADDDLPFFSQLYKDAFKRNSAEAPGSSPATEPAQPGPTSQLDSARAGISVPDGRLSRTGEKDRYRSWGRPQRDSFSLFDSDRAKFNDSERTRGMFEYKVPMDTTRDEEIRILYQQLDAANSSATSDVAATSNTRTKPTSSGGGWDLTGLLRDGLSAKAWVGGHKSSPPGVTAEEIGRQNEITRLKELVEDRNARVTQLQLQLEDMEAYLHREREAFQQEVDNRNRRLHEVRAQWEREKEISAAIMREKMELQQQLDQNAHELERRENWVKDLTARVNRQDNQVASLEQEVDTKRHEIDRLAAKVTRIQARLDIYESSIRTFRCYQVSLFRKTALNLVLQHCHQTGAFLCTLHRWDGTQHISFRDIISVSIAQIPQGSIGRWTMRGVTGRIMEWWGSDVVCASGEEVHQAQMKPKRAAFFGDYSFDALAAESRTVPERYIRVVLVQTHCSGNIALAFDDEGMVEECLSAFQYFLRIAANHDRDLHDEQKNYCLCELESFLFGSVLGPPPHPPLRPALSEGRNQQEHHPFRPALMSSYQGPAAALQQPGYRSAMLPLEGHERIPSDTTSQRLRVSPSLGPTLDAARSSVLVESPHTRYM